MKSNKNKIIYGIFSILLMIFLISLASAQTLVAGKIYTSNFSDTIDGASVYVECNNALCNNNPCSTTSLRDGTYAIRFDVGLCNVNDSVKVTATKNNLAGEGNGSVSVCNDESQKCDDGLVSIVNLNLKEVAQTSNPASGGGGSSGGYYLCGNGKCDSGETINTCPKDCKIIQNQTTQNQTIQTTNTETSNENSNTEETEEEIIPSETQTRVSRITGAVTGALGNFGLLIIIIFILGIIGLSLSVIIIRKRKANIEAIQ